MNSLKAFREEFVSASVLSEESFGNVEARKVRYDILWAAYESTIYRSIHSWAGTYKTRYALYRYIRNLYNPTYRIGEFWKAHLWGGPLDAEAGDTGTLPVITDNENIRPAIADIWKWSNWSTNKDVVTLHGSIYGDVILRVIDNVELGRIYIESIYPGIVTNLAKDPFGNIKGYTIEETRLSPVNNTPVIYKETAKRDGQNVVFNTFLNNVPFAWNGFASEWSEPYGFVPMVHIQHNDVGLEWGWSEIHPSRSKIHELDDLASLLSDQLRKSVNAKWFFTGVKASSPTQTMTTTETTARPEPGREEEPALYVSDPQAKAFPLVAPVNVEGMIMHIQELLKDLERDYPELKFDVLRATGEISGRALRIARQPVETKVEQRRANYDDGLKRAIQMAVSIGGLRNQFAGFNLDSYESGGLDFNFGRRDVFVVDLLEKYEEDKAFWETVAIAKNAGVPLLAYLESVGWDEEKLKKLRESIELQAELAIVSEPEPEVDD
jgi:hypothetical protein